MPLQRGPRGRHAARSEALNLTSWQHFTGRERQLPLAGGQHLRLLRSRAPAPSLPQALLPPAIAHFLCWRHLSTEWSERGAGGLGAI